MEIISEFSAIFTLPDDFWDFVKNGRVGVPENDVLDGLFSRALHGLLAWVNVQPLIFLNESELSRFMPARYMNRMKESGEFVEMYTDIFVTRVCVLNTFCMAHFIVFRKRMMNGTGGSMK